MKRPILKSLLTAGVLALGITACGSTPANKRRWASEGQPLVIVRAEPKVLACRFPSAWD